MTLALLALAVWMPATNPDVSAEIKRLQPEVVIATYTGSTITRQPGEAVVLLGEIGADNRVGVALSDGRVIVYQRTLERAIDYTRGHPLFRLAMARVIAHELEHLRRGGPEHDKAGWFSRCPSKRDLVDR